MYHSALLIEVGRNPDRPRPGRLWLRNLYRVHQRLCMAFPSARREAEDPDFLVPFRPLDFGDDQVRVPRGDSNGFLYRLDPLAGGGVVILVQSGARPNWAYAFCNAEYLLAAPPQVRPYEPSFEPGQRMRFRLVANATKKLNTPSAADRASKPDCTCRRTQRAAQAGLANLPHAPDCPVRQYRERMREREEGRAPRQQALPHGRRVPVPSDQLVAWLADRGPSAGFLLEKEGLVVQPGYAYARIPALGKGREDTAIRYWAVRYDGVLTVTDGDKLRQAVSGGIGPAKSFGFGLLSLAPVC